MGFFGNACVYSLNIYGACHGPIKMLYNGRCRTHPPGPRPEASGEHPAETLPIRGEEKKRCLLSLKTICCYLSIGTQHTLPYLKLPISYFLQRGLQIRFPQGRAHSTEFLQTTAMKYKTPSFRSLIPPTELQVASLQILYILKEKAQLSPNRGLNHWERPRYLTNGSSVCTSTSPLEAESKPEALTWCEQWVKGWEATVPRVRFTMKLKQLRQQGPAFAVAPLEQGSLSYAFQ